MNTHTGTANSDPLLDSLYGEKRESFFRKYGKRILSGIACSFIVYFIMHMAYVRLAVQWTAEVVQMVLGRPPGAKALDRGVSSNGTENRRKGRHAARSSSSSGSRSGRRHPCRIDSLRANSYRPSTLMWSRSSGESRSTSSGWIGPPEVRIWARAASR
jgi:hypothetical protein